uniref:Uncharacterized protein n=1 Tax=Ditylenchus dipsaci TaxID=166011 RepID=A0A915DNF9_9BILA
MKLGVGHISATEKNVFLQVVMISTLAVVVNLGLVAAQLFNDNLFIAMLTSISWPVYQGMPSIIYLSMNKTIQEELKSVFWKKKINKFSRGSAITPHSLRLPL